MQFHLSYFETVSLSHKGEWLAQSFVTGIYKAFPPPSGGFPAEEKDSTAAKDA